MEIFKFPREPIAERVFVTDANGPSRAGCRVRAGKYRAWSCCLRQSERRVHVAKRQAAGRIEQRLSESVAKPAAYGGEPSQGGGANGVLARIAQDIAMLRAREVNIIDIALEADDPSWVELPVATELAAAGKTGVVTAGVESRYGKGGRSAGTLIDVRPCPTSVAADVTAGPGKRDWRRPWRRLDGHIRRQNRASDQRGRCR